MKIVILAMLALLTTEAAAQCELISRDTQYTEWRELPTTTDTTRHSESLTTSDKACPNVLLIFDQVRTCPSCGRRETRQMRVVVGYREPDAIASNRERP